ncbi:hypothetical protein JW906_14860 [bacterium]|nr:hypothetical protein [bacterium]
MAWCTGRCRDTQGRLFFMLVAVLAASCLNNRNRTIPVPNPEPASPDIRIEMGTYLGNEGRNGYGNWAPSELKTVWKTYLGYGQTEISRRLGKRTWAGSGWTGQPLIVREDGHLFLLLGAYDHHLKKIDAGTGQVVWQYAFDDVIKGTGTLWHNPGAPVPEHRLIILQGSRLGIGNAFSDSVIPSFRAVSYFTGRELWRLNVRRTPSYSRDVDGSALVLGDTAYSNLENATFIKYSPDPAQASFREGILQPRVFLERLLFGEGDAAAHRGNLVAESSPCRIGDRIYITAGSGHVYGYDLRTCLLDWDFFIGSDMDGSPVATEDGCILVAVEKQYIPGRGGVFKLDPSRSPGEAVVWFFPTGNKDFNTWEGGVIGSACVNEKTRFRSHPGLAAFMGIDGYLYVVKHMEVDSASGNVPGPDLKTLYPQPRLVFKRYIGPSISTPVMVGDKLIAAGYGGLFLFQWDEKLKFTLLDQVPGLSFESTPCVHYRKCYIGCRDGYLYCFSGEEDPG